VSKYDIGTYVAAAVVGISSVLAWFQELIGRVLGALRVSFVALVSSRAVWFASIVVGLGAYCGGFWHGHERGSSEVPELRVKVGDLESALSKVVREAAADIKKARDEAAELKKRLEASEAPAGSPVAAVSRRPVAKSPKPAAPAAEPPRPFRPFDN